MKKNESYRNPIPTVDIIILGSMETKNDALVMIKRKNPPYGWALPGGFVDYGESLEQAAVREAKEETSLDVTLLKQFHTYSDPKRDPRMHTMSTVFIAAGKGELKGQDDALEAKFFPFDNLPETIAFDHRTIIEEYIEKKY